MGPEGPLHRQKTRGGVMRFLLLLLSPFSTSRRVRNNQLRSSITKKNIKNEIKKVQTDSEYQNRFRLTKMNPYKSLKIRFVNRNCEIFHTSKRLPSIKITV